MKVSLVVVKGMAKAIGMEFPIKKSKFLIGRNGQCHLRPNCEEVSAQHCVVETDGRSVAVRDLGTEHGTFLNGQRIEGKAAVGDGDVLRTGSFEFSFRVSASEPVKTPVTKPVAPSEGPEVKVTRSAAPPAKPVARPAAVVDKPSSPVEKPAAKTKPTVPNARGPAAQPGKSATPAAQPEKPAAGTAGRRAAPAKTTKPDPAKAKAAKAMKAKAAKAKAAKVRPTAAAGDDDEDIFDAPMASSSTQSSSFSMVMSDFLMDDVKIESSGEEEPVVTETETDLPVSEGASGTDTVPDAPAVKPKPTAAPKPVAAAKPTAAPQPAPAAKPKPTPAPEPIPGVDPIPVAQTGPVIDPSNAANLDDLIPLPPAAPATDHKETPLPKPTTDSESDSDELESSGDEMDFFMDNF